MSHQTIGLAGGTAPESTVLYYRYLTNEYARRHGDFGFPEILIYSVRFQDILDWGRRDEWDCVAEKMVAVFNTLRDAGADFGLMTANTLHLVFDDVARRTKLPLLSIVDSTVEAVAEAGCRQVGLLGTETTMRASFYPEALARRGIGALVPEEEDLKTTSRIIYEELVLGVEKEESKREYVEIIRRLQERGCDGVVLGCTEIPGILNQGDAPLRLFDTTRIHAARALERATRERGGSAN
jgi:aspartate racemase